ncbi:MAG: ribose transport system ATP-binding protein [Clostridiales bacterium]|nr:ribose transport system ATP-binding protein [Clostridiales bacterium]
MEEVKRMDGVLVSMQGIEKYFPGVHALKNVSLELRKGEVLALLGENGAGKSTLMKILTGVYNKDEGQIFFEGKEVQIDNPKAAQELGISIIHQEFNLLPHLTVAQNIFIGREPRTKIRGVLNEKELNRKAQIILDDLNLSMSPKTRVAELSVAEQQMVEIAKALSVQCKVLIMDEPTAALTESEVEELFRVIKDLKSKGVGIVYISHRLEELEYIVDRVTVMRDGAYIGTVNYKDTTLDELISMMVGRDITEKFPKRNVNVGETILEVKGLSRKDVLKDINFKLRRGNGIVPNNL